MSGSNQESQTTSTVKMPIEMSVSNLMYKYFSSERSMVPMRCMSIYTAIRSNKEIPSHPVFVEEMAKIKVTKPEYTDQQLYAETFYTLLDDKKLKMVPYESENDRAARFTRARGLNRSERQQERADKLVKKEEEKVKNEEVTYSTWDTFVATQNKAIRVTKAPEKYFNITGIIFQNTDENKQKKVYKSCVNDSKEASAFFKNVLDEIQYNGLANVTRGLTFEEISYSCLLASAIIGTSPKNYSTRMKPKFLEGIKSPEFKPVNAACALADMVWFFQNQLILYDESDNIYQFTEKLKEGRLKEPSLNIFAGIDEWATKANDLLVCLLCLFIRHSGHSATLVSIEDIWTDKILDKYKDKAWCKSMYAYCKCGQNELVGTDGLYSEEVRVINTKTYLENLAKHRDYAQTMALLTSLKYIPKKTNISASSEKIKIFNTNNIAQSIIDCDPVPAINLITWSVTEGLIAACPDNAEVCSKIMNAVVLPERCVTSLSNRGKLSIRIGRKAFVILSGTKVSPTDLSSHIAALASYSNPEVLFIPPDVLINLYRSTVKALIVKELGKSTEKERNDLLKKFRDSDGRFKYVTVKPESSQLEKLIYSFHHYSPNYNYAHLIKCGNWKMDPITSEEIANYLIGTSTLFLTEHSTLLASRCGMLKKKPGFETKVNAISEAQKQYNAVMNSGATGTEAQTLKVKTQADLIKALYSDKPQNQITMLYSLTSYGQTGIFNVNSIGYEPDWANEKNKLVAVERTTVELALATNDGFAEHILENPDNKIAQGSQILTSICNNAMSPAPFIVTYDAKVIGGGNSGTSQVTNIGNVSAFNVNMLDKIYLDESSAYHTSELTDVAKISGALEHDEAVAEVYKRGIKILSDNLTKATGIDDLNPFIKSLKILPGSAGVDTAMYVPKESYMKYAAPGPDTLLVKIGDIQISFNTSYSSFYSMFKGEELVSQVHEAINSGKLTDEVKKTMIEISHVAKSSNSIMSAIEILGLSFNPALTLMNGQTRKFKALLLYLINKSKKSQQSLILSLISLSKTKIDQKLISLGENMLKSYFDTTVSPSYYEPLGSMTITDYTDILGKEDMALLSELVDEYEPSELGDKNFASVAEDHNLMWIKKLIPTAFKGKKTLKELEDYIDSKEYKSKISQWTKEEEDKVKSKMSDDEKKLYDILMMKVNDDYEYFSKACFTDYKMPSFFAPYSFDDYSKILNIFADPKAESHVGNFVPQLEEEFLPEEECKKKALIALRESALKYKARINTLRHLSGADPEKTKFKDVKFKLLPKKDYTQIEEEHDEDEGNDSDSGTTSETEGNEEQKTSYNEISEKLKYKDTDGYFSKDHVKVIKTFGDMEILNDVSQGGLFKENVSPEEVENIIEKVYDFPDEDVISVICREDVKEVLKQYSDDLTEYIYNKNILTKEAGILINTQEQEMFTAFEAPENFLIKLYICISFYGFSLMKISTDNLISKIGEELYDQFAKSLGISLKERTIVILLTCRHFFNDKQFGKALNAISDIGKYMFKKGSLVLVINPEIQDPTTINCIKSFLERIEMDTFLCITPILMQGNNKNYTEYLEVKEFNEFNKEISPLMRTRVFMSDKNQFPETLSNLIFAKDENLKQEDAEVPKTPLAIPKGGQVKEEKDPNKEGSAKSTLETKESKEQKSPQSNLAPKKDQSSQF